MRDYEQGKNSLVVAQFTRLLYSKKRGAMNCATRASYIQRTRKELACSRAIHAPLIFKEKRARELRDYEQGKNSLVVAQFTRLLYSKKRGAMNCATTNLDILVLCVI